MLVHDKKDMCYYEHKKIELWNKYKSKIVSQTRILEKWVKRAYNNTIYLIYKYNLEIIVCSW